MSDQRSLDPKIEASVSVPVPRHDAFGRNRQPIGDNDSSPAWNVMRLTIDYAAFLFRTHVTLRQDQRVRDLVMVALLRRGIITAEGCLCLLRHGLLEPAMAQCRTLFDIELTARLVAEDATDRRARKFAAYHYYLMKRHGQRMLSNPQMRAVLKQGEGDWDSTLAATRRHSEYFESNLFDDVRDDVVPGKPWHGFASQEDAFNAVDASGDYLSSYDLGTMFVHAANVDFDFAGIVNGEVQLKIPQTRNTRDLWPTLGLALGRFWSILQLVAADRPIPNSATVTLETGESFPIDQLSGLATIVTNALNSLMSQDANAEA